MECCPDCGVLYERDFDHEETFDYHWVPRCSCHEENKLVNEQSWGAGD